MRKRRSERILLLMVGLFLAVICVLMVYIVVFGHGRNSSSKKFVDYLIEHVDETSADFEECGLVFSTAEEGNMLIVTDADGWHFYYQTLEKHGDELVKIEGSVEKMRGEELLTGILEIKRRERNYAYVEIECETEEYWEVRALTYRVPEFDEYKKNFKDAETVMRINQWISNEELSALYKKGKELEEILSEYCKLKSHNVDVSIHHYASP